MLAFYQTNTGAGRGDSGGPAVLSKNGNKINVGASSWGYYPKDQLPTIYTNIRNYSAWIQTTTGFNISKASSPDLYAKDWDMGKQPSGVNYLWESEDIWVRNQPDGGINDTHQNPEYYTQANNHNYVYVKVRNRGCLPSAAGAKVKLYWAKGATALAWPTHWNGSLAVAGQSLGNYIGEYTLPAIQPGSAGLAVFQWRPPNPANYVGLSTDPLFWADEPHHFCLLARIEAIDDPIAPETSDLGANVDNNNNIVWKNLSVVDLNPNNIVNGGRMKTGASVLVGSAWNNAETYDIEFANPPYFRGKPITEEAEITITLEQRLWLKWQQGGFQQQNIKILDQAKYKLLIMGSNARLSNLTFQANERNLLHLNFNFLTQELSEKHLFGFNVIQKRHHDQSVVGGEQYAIGKYQRTKFDANAGSDAQIEALETTTLSAYQIGEQAIYKWYDEAGNLIYTGKDLTVSPDVTSKYKLEVEATIDGFKDYDEVEVKVKLFAIKSISPNPSRNIININYKANTANSAYLIVVPLLTNATSHQYLLSTAQTTRTIDVSAYPLGQYPVILMCDGAIADFKNILIQ